LTDDIRHNFSCCTKISDRSKFICELCSFAKLLVKKIYIKKTSKQILEWIKYNLEELEGSNLDFEDCGAKIHYQDLHTKFWYVIMYLIPYKILYKIHIYFKPIYNIEPRIIFKTYICMQGPSCSTLTLIL
jgi:hypothetical protein